MTPPLLRFFYLIILFVGIGVLVFACVELVSYGDLRVRVTSGDIPIQDAEVTLYRTEEDYNLEQNPHRATILTNDQGSVSFFGLEDTLYYLNVSKDNLNNWESERVKRSIIITENGFNNAQSYSISITKSSLLASATGKSWQIQSVSLAGSDITASYPTCKKDNIFTFFKGGVYQESNEDVLCESSDPTISEGVWQLEELNTKVSIALEGGENYQWNIISLTENSLRVEYATNYEGSDVVLDIVFEAL